MSVPRDEQTVFGVKAALAVLERRPQDVLRIFHAPALRGTLGPHLARAAERRLPYRELDAAALVKVAGSQHHEGLVVVAAPLRYAALPAQAGRLAGPAALWLALDRVENPHNLGAMLRTAAFFGLSGVLAGGATPGEKVNAAVLRVSEGGAEQVPLLAAPELPPALRALREGGTRVLGLETDGPLPLSDAVGEGLTAGPLALVLGREHEGLSAAVRACCDLLCVLRGSTRLDALASLNVSVAAGVALAEVMRARPEAAALALPKSSTSRPSRPSGRGAARDGRHPSGYPATAARPPMGEPPAPSAPEPAPKAARRRISANSGRRGGGPRGPRR